MSKSENNHDNSDLQMLKEEVSEKEYQNAQYEAEKKKHISYWLKIIAPFIMILAIFIFYYCFIKIAIVYNKKKHIFIEAAENVAPKALKKIVNWKIIFLIRYFLFKLKESQNLWIYLSIILHFFLF